MVKRTFPFVIVTLPPPVQAAPVLPPPPPPAPGGLPACGEATPFGATTRGTAGAMRWGVQYATTAPRSGFAAGAAAELPAATKTAVTVSAARTATNPTFRRVPRRSTDSS